VTTPKAVVGVPGLLWEVPAPLGCPSSARPSGTRGRNPGNGRGRGVSRRAQPGPSRGSRSGRRLARRPSRSIGSSLEGDPGPPGLGKHRGARTPSVTVTIGALDVSWPLPPQRGSAPVGETNARTRKRRGGRRHAQPLRIPFEAAQRLRGWASPPRKTRVRSRQVPEFCPRRGWRPPRRSHVSPA